jgi:hypothetical protein
VFVDQPERFATVLAVESLHEAVVQFMPMRDAVRGRRGGGGGAGGGGAGPPPPGAPAS